MIRFSLLPVMVFKIYSLSCLGYRWSICSLHDNKHFIYLLDVQEVTDLSSRITGKRQGRDGETQKGDSSSPSGSHRKMAATRSDGHMSDSSPSDENPCNIDIIDKKVFLYECIIKYLINIWWNPSKWLPNGKRSSTSLLSSLELWLQTPCKFKFLYLNMPKKNAKVFFVVVFVLTLHLLGLTENGIVFAL